MMAIKFGIAISREETEILRVFDTREEAVAYGRALAALPRKQGTVFCFSAEYTGNRRTDNRMKIYDYFN